MLQEWKLNLDAEEYEKKMKATIYKPSEKNKFNRVNSDDHWPTSIKKTIQWFPFHNIMEHTANKMKDNNRLISSLLNMLSCHEFLNNNESIVILKFSHRMFE